MTGMVKRINGRLAVVIPPVIATKSGLIEGESLEVSATAFGILLRPPGQRPRRSVAALVKQIVPGRYARRTAESHLDSPIGREVG